MNFEFAKWEGLGDYEGTQLLGSACPFPLCVCVCNSYNS